MAASPPVPPVVVDEIHAEEGAVRQGDEGFQFADDVPGSGVSGVQHAPAHRVLGLKGGTTAPAGDSSILSRPPEVFSIVSTSSFAASWTIDVGGQALCTFHWIGAGPGLEPGWNGRIVRAGVEGEEGDDERERHRKPQGDHLAHIHPSCATTG